MENLDAMENFEPPKRAGLIQLLQSSIGSQFVVPVYQRNYTWVANKEVKQYFDDLENILKGKYDRHFLGILIYLVNPIDYASREFSIIDGQQRLTTTFLILYAVRRLMIERGLNDDAKKLEEQLLINQFVDDKLKLKLKPLVSDDKVYRQIVDDQINEITNKSSKIYNNFVWICEKLKKLLSVYTFNDILMALNKLYVVCVPVANSDSPQKIFESINSTGAKLTSADLIRNFVLMDLQSELQDELYEKYWKKIEEYLEYDSKKIELFFRMFLACKLQILPNISAVYAFFKDWFDTEKEGGKDIVDILRDIVAYAKYYNALYFKDISSIDTGIRTAIKDYRNNWSEMPAPLLMEFYSLYRSIDEEGKPLISTEQFNQLVQIVNIYLVRRSICARDTSDITRIFPTILKDVVNECNGDYKNIVEILKKNLVNKNRGKSSAMPTDEDLRTYLATANVYNNRATLRVIFDKIETCNNSAPVDLSKLSVEHLMPQTPTKEWLEALNIDTETYEKNLHRLGNLTLASKVDNSKMKNKVWEYKKEILADTAHLIMNQKILKNEKWGIAEIDARNSELIEEIIKVYPYVSAASDVIVKYNISIDYNDVFAIATLYEEDGSVEISEGSEIVKYDVNTPDQIVELYNSLLDDNVIRETNNGAIFTENYLVRSLRKNSTSLSTAANLILGGNRNGWSYWKDENGKLLSENKRLKKVLTENQNS